MIIIGAEDTASVLTVVPEQDTAPSQGRLPRLLSLLSFASIAVSIPPYIFGIINSPISYLYTIPSICAFVLILPFHVGVVHTFSTVWRQNSYQPLQFRSQIRAIIVIYASFLQITWLLNAAMCGMAVMMRGKQEGELCYRSTPGAQHACVQKMLATFLLTTIFSSIEVLLLGAISVILLKADFSDGSPEESTASGSSNDDPRSHHRTYSLIPLTFASFGISLPPFIFAFLYTLWALYKGTDSTVYIYTIPILLAYISTTYIQTSTLLSWNRESSHVTPKIWTPIPSKAGIARLVVLSTLWILSAANGARVLLNRRSWGLVCFLEGWSSSCSRYPPLSLIVVTILSSIEAIILVCMTVISYKNLPRAQRTAQIPALKREMSRSV
ncbi:hypothetical protein BJ165DRAFT_1526877 [Panaeolus papilionaceus]|nr:hypothetical protein BJ165DRAFT_1526877 [Panaeolus papilionaceus]